MAEADANYTQAPDICYSFNPTNNTNNGPSSSENENTTTLLQTFLFIVIINLFSVDQINRIQNHSVYAKTIAIIEDKC